jgi:hypothetical protein
MQFRG